MTLSDIELTDRLTRRRARAATALGIIFIATQGVWAADPHMTRAVDYVQAIGWVIWAAVLCIFLLFGGGLFRGSTVRALMNDESTEANRRQALVGGFWILMATAGVCYIVSLFKAVEAREAIHVIITTGVAGALIRFGALERKAAG